MKKNGDYLRINKNMMDAISAYMDDDKREQVHFELAPCEPEDFLKRYLELDPDFEKVLKSEFDVEM